MLPGLIRIEAGIRRNGGRPRPEWDIWLVDYRTLGPGDGLGTPDFVRCGYYSGSAVPVPWLRHQAGVDGDTAEVVVRDREGRSDEQSDSLPAVPEAGAPAQGGRAGGNPAGRREAQEIVRRGARPRSAGSGRESGGSSRGATWTRATAPARPTSHRPAASPPRPSRSACPTRARCPPGHLLVASIAILEPSPGFGLAKSR